MAKRSTKGKKPQVSAGKLIAHIRKTTKAVEKLKAKASATEAERLQRKLAGLKNLEATARGLCRSQAI